MRSKVGQDLLGYQYAMSYGLKVIRTRGFNHTGPRRGDVFVESNFAQQIAKIEKGLQKPLISVGNLGGSPGLITDVRTWSKLIGLPPRNASRVRIQYLLGQGLGHKGSLGYSSLFFKDQGRNKAGPFKNAPLTWWSCSATTQILQSHRLETWNSLWADFAGPIELLAGKS